MLSEAKTATKNSPKNRRGCWERIGNIEPILFNNELIEMGMSDLRNRRRTASVTISSRRRRNRAPLRAR